MGAKGTILVVDDEPGVVKLCERLLDRAGFTAFTTTLPREGLEILAHQSIDLLLVDIRMPEMSGFQLMDAARQRSPELAVVVMTGFGTLETAIEALQRGADGLTLKPFTGKELVGSVQHALEQSRTKQDVIRLQALRPLFDISETLFSETNPKRLQRLLLNAVCGHLHCSMAALFQRNDNGKSNSSRLRLILSHSSHDNENNVQQRSDNAGVLGKFLNRQNFGLDFPIIANVGVPGDSAMQASLVEAKLSSILCAPITSRGSSAHHFYLVAARTQPESAFRESDLEMFVILANQAGVALENAHLTSELRDYIRQLEDSQRALIQAEKMAIAGRLTASIAHEINNPLQAVQNCLHLANHKQMPPDQRQSYLDLAQSELERLMKTVQQMLDYYRPGAVDRKPTNLHALIHKVLALMEKQVLDHQIHVSLSLAEDIPQVLVVADQIQQVFLNLFLNAIEAMPAGGEVTIKTRSLGTEVEIIFQDNGPGVPAERRKQIFEPFVSTKEHGTGLGLAVSYGIISAHGGSLELLDNQQTGACFRIQLPVGES